MKNILSKIITVLQITAIIIFFLLVFFLLFNWLEAYKIASGNDLISFVGGIIGSLIAGAIAIITFYYTIKNNDKNQKEAHELQTKINIENNNLQASLKMQDNLNRKLETERSVLATTYNHLENFLFSVSTMIIQKDNYIEMKNDYLRLYNEVLSSINNIRFNSEIFDDRSQCENCSMCEFKTYGALVKSASDIQKEMSIIDEECRLVLSHLEVALNTAAQSKQLTQESSMLQQMNINNERMVEIRKSQIINKTGSYTPEEVNYYNEITSISNNISANNKRILEINGLLDANLKTIGDQSTLARNKAGQIDAKNKTRLYILIRKHFSNYNLYINEVVFSVQKNGKKLNRGCAKIDFEKNHTANKEM